MSAREHMHALTRLFVRLLACLKIVLLRYYHHHFSGCMRQRIRLIFSFWLLDCFCCCRMCATYIFCVCDRGRDSKSDIAKKKDKERIDIVYLACIYKCCVLMAFIAATYWYFCYCCAATFHSQLYSFIVKYKMR